MRTISLGLVFALFVIGAAVNLIWLTGWGYIPLGIYLVVWLIGWFRERNG